jgi:hypothetical protein
MEKLKNSIYNLYRTAAELNLYMSLNDYGSKTDLAFIKNKINQIENEIHLINEKLTT